MTLDEAKALLSENNLSYELHEFHHERGCSRNCCEQKNSMRYTIGIRINVLSNRRSDLLHPSKQTLFYQKAL